MNVYIDVKLSLQSAPSKGDLEEAFENVNDTKQPCLEPL